MKLCYLQGHALQISLYSCWFVLKDRENTTNLSWKPVLSRQFACYFAHIISFKPFQDTEISNSLCCCYCSVAKSCLTLCNPMDCSMLGSSILHYLPEFAQIYAHWVSDAILCHSLLLWPLVIPSIKVFFSESALHIRWPKYWSFSFNTIPSMSIWDWFPIKLTSLNSFQSKGFSRGFYNSTTPYLPFIDSGFNFLVQDNTMTLN